MNMVPGCPPFKRRHDFPPVLFDVDVTVLATPRSSPPPVTQPAPPASTGILPAGTQRERYIHARTWGQLLEASSSARIFSTSGRKLSLIPGEHDASLMDMCRS